MKVLTLSLLKYLSDNGFGTIDQNLFWEKLGLGKNGLYITDVGDAQERGVRKSTTYELYSRGDSDLDGYAKLQAVAEFLRESYDVCDLPAVPPYSDEGFTGVSILPPSTISSMGEDGNGRIIYSITGRVYYD